MGWKLKSTITECGISPFFFLLDSFFVWALHISHCHIHVSIYFSLLCIHTVVNDGEQWTHKHLSMSTKGSVTCEMNWAFTTSTHTTFDCCFLYFYFLSFFFCFLRLSSACLTTTWFLKTFYTTQSFNLYSYPFQCCVLLLCECFDRLVNGRMSVDLSQLSNYPIRWVNERNPIRTGNILWQAF